MAKINIEKKNRNTRLIWILVLFIFFLLGIIWWLNTDDETTGGENRPVTEQLSFEGPLTKSAEFF